MKNIEIVKELYRSIREKDYDSFKNICSPDIEWIQNKGFPHGGIHRGADEVIENVFNSFSNEWEQFGFQTNEFIEGKSSVVVLGKYVGVARKTHKSMSADACHVYALMDGKVIRFRQYTDTKIIEDALASGNTGGA